MAEIASASDQQSQGIDQITTAVQQMSDMTQQNAANSEESAASAVELDNLAHKMQKMVDAFQLGDLQGKQGASFMPTAKDTFSSKGMPVKRAAVSFGEGDWKPNGHGAPQNMAFSGDIDPLIDF
jgi:uncharacterized protein YegL